MTANAAAKLLSQVAILALIAGASPALAQQGGGASTTQKAGAVLTGKKPASKAKNGEESEREVISGAGGRLEGDIIVTGLRENVKTARTAKRRAQQIVDVIVAQDIGRLPDKNVPETLARVPGIQIDRERGEGTQVRIRGLGGVLTTVNGSASFSAGDRTTYMQDISSDLVGAVEVFKTRTPDQIEGSQTGVINISLRRPTDFKNGTTLALNVAADYPDQVKKANPYVSALFVQNGETSVGQIGYSINATYQKINYLESRRWNGFPVTIGNNRQLIDPGTTPAGLVLPSSVGFTYVRGEKTVGEVRMSTSWRPDEHWQIIMEAGFSDQRMDWQDDQFSIPITFSESSAPPPRLSNIVVGPDGRLVSSARVDSLDPFGPGKASYLHNTRNYSGRFQAEYRDEQIEFTSWLNYQRSNNYSNNLFHYTRFDQLPSFDVEFNTDKDPRGGQNVTFRGIDLLDPGNYPYVDGYFQDRQYTLSAESEWKADLRLNTFMKFIDYFKIGGRFAERDYDRQFGNRGQGGLRLPTASIPGYELTPVGQGFAGTTTSSNANWLSGSGANFRQNWDAIRSTISSISPASNNIGNYFPNYNPNAFFTGTDSSLAFYGMFHYNIDFIFPIEGIVGLRGVNTMTQLSSFRRNFVLGTVNGQPATVEERTPVRSRGNYYDVLPSVNAIMHFTDKLQLRAAWTKDFGRPSAYDLNPVLNIDARNPASPVATGGNDRLSAIDMEKYDLSLEWYFGKTGSMSIAAWQWYQDGFIQRQTSLQTLPGFSVPVLVNRPVNSGRGRHKGIEFSATSFFSFLPGILSSFGASGNFTYNDTRQANPTINADGVPGPFVYGPYLFVSKYMYNVIGFFERGGLNVRATYNWRSRRENSVDPNYFYNNQFFAPVDRLDASINYDITENFTIALQATNITRAGENLFWGSRALPRDVTYFSRNYNASIRMRF